MKIVRPWASEGDYFEILVPEDEDWTRFIEETREHLRTLTTEEKTEAAIRYLQSKYGSSQDDS